MIIMTKTDNIFLDEYKRLERLCSDMYRDQSGVSRYIGDMEAWHIRGDDYYSLKHVRWLRNQLVHDVDPEHASQKDIDFVRKFYERIMRKEDPLAFDRKGKGKKASRRKTAVRNNAETKTTKKKHVKKIFLVLIVILALAAAIACAMYFGTSIFGT